MRRSASPHSMGGCPRSGADRLDMPALKRNSYRRDSNGSQRSYPSLEGGDDHAEEDKQKVMLSSIERMGCHIPKCVALSLEDNPLEASAARQRLTDQQQHSLNRSSGRRSSMGRRLSWSSASTGISSSWASASFRRESDDSSSLKSLPPQEQFPLPLENANLRHTSALLLVDISGFTKLSTLLDVESLSKAINHYFQLLIEEVEIFGGDVLKFAGDAFFAEWVGEDDEDLEDAVTKAALCGANIVQKFSRYEVRGNHHETGKETITTLDVHCGLGVGELAIIHVGNHESRREFLVLGDPIDQVSSAEDMAAHGELAASPEAIELLMNVCDVSEEIIDSSGAQVIASKDQKWFTSDELLEEDIKVQPEPYRLSYVSAHTIEELEYQMSLYVHPAARRDDFGVDHDISQRIIADAELRSVFTIFVKPLINPKITGDEYEDRQLFGLLNDIMCVTGRVLDRFKGHLRQFIVDDKGVVLIATFGQRGATFPNMVTEKGLPCTSALYDALKIELDVDCHVGATIGKVYCGVVGGSRRHEFAVLGPSVNLAARLMSSKNNPGILVDDSVRRLASKRFDFLSLPPVKAKGYPDLVPIFEPHSAIERQWNKINNFVGREKELEDLTQVAGRALPRKGRHADTQLVLIQGHSGLGKSSLAMQVIEKVRQMGGRYQQYISVKKNVCKDGEERVPFCVFRPLILDLLSERYSEDANDDISQDSDSSLSMDDELLIDDSSSNSDRAHLGHLRELCRDLKHSEEFADTIGANMLGLTCVSKTSAKEAMQPNEVVDFVADAFLTCTSRSNFVVLAIDDVQWMDSLSWQVVQRLFERGGDLLIICNSRPLASNRVSIDPDFLKSLRSQSKDVVGMKKSRFTEITLQPLGKDDIRTLLSKALECPAKCIDDQVCDSLYEQSGGMPYFAMEILENMMRLDLFETHQDGSVGWRSGLSDYAQKFLYANVNDLLLHRLDNLDAYARTLLQVCAVLGFEFSLSELLMVQCKGRRKTASQIQKIQDSLNIAAKERILVEVYKGGSIRNRASKIASHRPTKSAPVDVAERSYMFTHAIWRKCVLGTMLSERRRDLHRTVATILEKEGFGEVIDPRSALKLLQHWCASGNLMKASLLAREVAKHFENLNLYHPAIEVYIDAVNMWKARSADDVSTELCAEPSMNLLNGLSPDEVECVTRMYLGLAKDYINSNQAKTAAPLFQCCDRILSTAPAAAELKDRTICFSVFSGLFIIIKGGHIMDENNAYEQDLAKRFVEQARLHGDPIHITRALAMNSLLLGGLGKFEEAIEEQRRVEEIYDPETLSAGIIREYASDRVAQNYGYSTLWYEILGRHEESQNQIDYILEELMPKMDKRNVHNSIMILLPVLWRLLEEGRARKAESVFLHCVYDRFYEFYGKDSSTYFFYLYKPLLMLIQLAGDEQERGSSTHTTNYREPAEYEEMMDWVLDPEVGIFRQFDIVSMCALGRDPYSVIAEICWRLANIQDIANDRQSYLINKGFNQCLESHRYTHSKKGYEHARRISDKMLALFKSKMDAN